jgi:ribonuclease P/MRP protein subunit POP3
MIDCAWLIHRQTNLPELLNLTTYLDSIPTLAAPWLSSPAQQQQLIPTHIKQVRTSAPKDMKAAKERRAEGKALAKQHPQLIPTSQ